MPDTDASRERVRAAYVAHGAELYRFALRGLGEPGAAQDAVQETFLRAWRARDRYDPMIAGLRRLGEDHRVALQQTYLADRPYSEVAAELGIPESTPRSRVFYGLKALRVVMEEMEVLS